MKIYILIPILAAIMSSCAAQQPLLKQTQSGYPEGVFIDSTVDDVRSKIIEGCSSTGNLVQEASEHQVVCGKTMDGGEGILAQMLVGNSYSTTPVQKVRFIIYKSTTDVKVTAEQWIETQMAMGQLRKLDLNENNQRNSTQQFLFSIGAK